MGFNQLVSQTNNDDQPTESERADFPVCITDALYVYLARKPGSAWLAHAEIVPDDRGHRLVCRLGSDSQSWRIRPADVTRAPKLIAEFFEDLKGEQERPC